MAYNYLEEMKKDIETYIDDNIKIDDFEREELEEKLNEDLWVEDSVTGNASGSYTFNSYQAQENLFGNEDLIEEVKNEYGIAEGREYDWEYLDVSIRCYLLGQAISEVLDLYY